MILKDHVYHALENQSTPSFHKLEWSTLEQPAPIYQDIAQFATHLKREATNSSATNEYACIN